MKPELRERLGRLAELNDDELSATQLEIADALGTLPGDELAATAELGALTIAATAVDRQFATRNVALAAAAPPLTPNGQVQRMAARQRRPRPSPEALGTRPRRSSTVVASPALRGLRDPSKPIANRYELAEAMAETLQGMDRHGPARGNVVLASVYIDYPDERKLGPDAWENEQKIDATNALTATGGICLPVNVDYAVPVWATPDRPLRDGLPGYQATRGGIRFVQPPDIGPAAAATGIWTEATDLAPGAATKPLMSIACGTEQLVYVEAISTRLGFGNMQSRFAPEQVAANTNLATAAAARTAETNILNLIAAQCVAAVTTPTTGADGLLGAARELITAIHQATAAYRSGHRISPTQTLTAIFPWWVLALVKVDLAREQAHGNSSNFNVLSITDEQATSLLEDSCGLNCLFHLDGQPSSVAGGIAQLYGIQGASATLLAFPTKVVWYLWVEGAIQFLDAGRLDLGVVRDSTLDATNDMELFVEVFEAIAYRGFPSGAVQYVSTIAATGASAVPIDAHTELP